VNRKRYIRAYDSRPEPAYLCYDYTARTLCSSSPITAFWKKTRENGMGLIADFSIRRSSSSNWFWRLIFWAQALSLFICCNWRWSVSSWYWYMMSGAIQWVASESASVHYRHISIHFRHWLSFSPHLSASACLLLSTDWTKLNPLTTYSGGAGPKNYPNRVVLNVSMQKWISYLEVILHVIRAGNRGCG